MSSFYLSSRNTDGNPACFSGEKAGAEKGQKETREKEETPVSICSDVS